MRNRLKFAALICTAFAGIALCMSVTSPAQAAEKASEKASGPTFTRAVAKPLKAAQEAIAAKNWDAALTDLKEAESAPGQRNAYEEYIIDAWRATAYSALKDQPNTLKYLQLAVQSQYATPQQRTAWRAAIFGIYYEQKNYPLAVQAGDEAIKDGNNDAGMIMGVAQAEYLQKKYKEAAARMQPLVDRQQKPSEDSLKFLWDCYAKAGDDSAAGKIIEKLVTYYPKPDYWLNALAPLLQLDTHDEHLQLEIYRLMDELGVLKRPMDFTDLAQYAMDQGYPGETVTVLEEAFSRNIYTDKRDNERNQRLLTGAKTRSATDKAQLAQTEKDAEASTSGESYVGLGGAYLSYHDYDKAIAAVNKGIAKGGLKRPDEATLLQGIAYFRAKNLPAARKAFNKLSDSKSMGYARLGRLWAIHAKG